MPKRDEAIQIYRYITDRKSNGFEKMKDSFLKHQDDILFISGDYDSYVNLSGELCPKTDEIKGEFISLLKSSSELILKSDYGNYLINKHNALIPRSTNDILSELFSFSTPSAFFEKYFSEKELKKLSTNEITMMVSTYSNKMAKLIKASTINSLVKLNNKNSDNLNNVQLKSILKNGSKMYSQYITKTDDNISIDDCNNPDKQKRKIALDIMKKNNIPEEKYSDFVYTLLLFQTQDNLYSIKDNSVKDLALNAYKQGNNEKSSLRMYISKDENTQTFSNNTYNDSYRIYSICKDFYTPLIQHIPKDMFDSFVKDKKIDVQMINKNSSIYKNSENAYPLNFKVDESKLEKLNNANSRYVDNYFSIKNFKTRISPTQEEIKNENVGQINRLAKIDNIKDYKKSNSAPINDSRYNKYNNDPSKYNDDIQIM